MKAIERTTKRFIASLKIELPDFGVHVERSRKPWGQSNYIYIRHPKGLREWKVRVSDHPIGMKRAKYGNEDLLLWAGAIPDNWCVWLSEFVKENGGDRAPFKIFDHK